MKNRRLLVAWFLGFMLSWPLISGMEYAKFRHDFCDFTTGSWRQDAGFATAHGGFTALFWPVTLPGAYLITGFAEYGIGPWNDCPK